MRQGNTETGVSLPPSRWTFLASVIDARCLQPPRDREKSSLKLASVTIVGMGLKHDYLHTHQRKENPKFRERGHFSNTCEVKGEVRLTGRITAIRGHCSARQRIKKRHGGSSVCTLACPSKLHLAMNLLRSTNQANKVVSMRHTCKWYRIQNPLPVRKQSQTMSLFSDHCRHRFSLSYTRRGMAARRLTCDERKTNRVEPRIQGCEIIG